MKSIFVSSTFKDMQAERDALVKSVIPELDIYAQNFGQNIRFVDLRWGVNTTKMSAENSSRKVLKVCLDEIDKTHPYMIILIGERYGWVPEDKELITRVANEKGHRLDSPEKSVTELEIEYGALSEKGELKNCLFYFREPLPTENIPGDFKGVYIEEKPELEQKLQSLKARIIRAGGKVQHYTAQWNDSKKELDIPQNFCEMVTEDVKALFAAEFDETKNLTPMQREQIFAFLFAEQKAAQFAARFDLLKKYTDTILSQEKNLLLLTGAPGSGKSTIMSKLAMDLKKKANVFFFSCGNSTMSQTALDIVRGSVYFVETLLNKQSHYGEGENEPKHSFAEWVSVLEDLCEQYGENSETSENDEENKTCKKPLLFFIDALDQLAQDEDTRGLRFLPHKLPKCASFVISALSEYQSEIDEIYPLIEQSAKEEVTPLHDKERAKVVHGILKTYRKQLNKGVVNALIAAQGATNPLYISMMIQRLIMLDSEDFGVIAQFGNDMDAINKFLIDTIQNTPDNVEEMSAEVLREAAQRINEELCLHVAALIATSRRGLRESDLATIIEKSGEAWLSVDFASYIKYLKPFFIHRYDGRIDFTHRTIRLGFLKTIDFNKYNDEVLWQIKRLPMHDAIKTQEVTYHALMQKDFMFYIGHVANIYRLSDETDAAAKTITASEMYNMALTQARLIDELLLYFIQSIKTIKLYWQCDFVIFTVNNFISLFQETELENLLLVEFLANIIDASELLAQAYKENENLEISLCVCYGKYSQMLNYRRLYLPDFDIIDEDEEFVTIIKCREMAMGIVEKYNSLASRLNLYNIYYEHDINYMQSEEYPNRADELSRLNISETRLEFYAMKTYEDMINSGDYSVLTQYCNFAMRFTEGYKGKRFVQAAYELLKNLYNSKSIAAAQFATAALNLGYIYYNKHNFNVAQNYYFEALTTCEELVKQNASPKNYLLYAKVMRYYGLNFAKQRQYKTAIRLHTKSAEICDKFIDTIGDHDCYIGLARSYEYKADCYEAMGDMEKVYENYRECYKISYIITYNFPVNEIMHEEARIEDLFMNKYGAENKGFVGVINDENLRKEQKSVKAYEYIADNFNDFLYKFLLQRKYYDLNEQFKRFKMHENSLQAIKSIVEIFKNYGKDFPQQYPGESSSTLITWLIRLCGAYCVLKRHDEEFETYKQITVVLNSMVEKNLLNFEKLYASTAFDFVLKHYNDNDDLDNAEKTCIDGIELFQKTSDNFEQFLLNSNDVVKQNYGISDTTKEGCEYTVASEKSSFDELKNNLNYELGLIYLKRKNFAPALEKLNEKRKCWFKKYTYTDKNTGVLKCSAYNDNHFDGVKVYEQMANAYLGLNDKESAVDALESAEYLHLIDEKYTLTSATKDAKISAEYSALCDKLSELLHELGQHESAEKFTAKKARVLNSLAEHEKEKKEKEETKKKAPLGTRSNPIIKEYIDENGNRTGATMKIYTDESGQEIVEIHDY